MAVIDVIDQTRIIPETAPARLDAPRIRIDYMQPFAMLPEIMRPASKARGNLQNRACRQVFTDAWKNCTGPLCG